MKYPRLANSWTEVDFLSFSGRGIWNQCGIMCSLLAMDKWVRGKNRPFNKGTDLTHDGEALIALGYMYVSECGCVQWRGHPLELELPLVVSYLTWVLGTKRRFSARAVLALDHWDIPPGSHPLFWHTVSLCSPGCPQTFGHPALGVSWHTEL